MKTNTRTVIFFVFILTSLIVFFFRLVQALPSLLATTTAPLDTPANRTDTGEGLAQETPTVLEVPPGGKPTQEIGNLLRVEVDSLQLLEEGKVVVFLTFVNKTKEDLRLSLHQPEQKTFALDEQGNMYRYENSSGISGISFTPLLCPASGQSTASLVLSPAEKNDRRGWSFSVTSELVLRGNKPPRSHINVSFRGIRPQNMQMQGR